MGSRTAAAAPGNSDRCELVVDDEPLATGAGTDGAEEARSRLKLGEIDRWDITTVSMIEGKETRPE